MKVLTSIMLGMVVLCSAGMAAENTPGSVPAAPARVARALVERLLPGRSDIVVFESIPAAEGRDVFELESRDGKVLVRGNSALSMAVGLNWYLKYYCHCNVSINGRQLNLPPSLPVVEKKFRLASWAKCRYLFNYCTFGYVTPWWDWPQWERFIDWMALNGVNMPLAVTGQEGVWEAVCRKSGMSEEEIRAFLPGPPYLPFCWMGCLDGHGGPLPRNWTARHVELGQRVLARERELGMTPVLQGFTGHVPEALVKKFPGTKVHHIHWAEWDTCMLDPLDPLFPKLARSFIEEQTRLFGSDHFYDSDTFIEMIPPSGQRKFLADAARAIYDGMAKTDPEAVWVFQGWTFGNQLQFWSPERVKAFLDAVPDDRMLILDMTWLWHKPQAFCGKPWVWSLIYTFGDNQCLGGGLAPCMKDLADARRQPRGQKFRGMAMLMEGFGHNPLVYELTYELAWRDHVDLTAWMREYARFRYGPHNPQAESAWDTLRAGLYEHGSGHDSMITTAPDTGCKYATYHAGVLEKTWQLLLQADKELAATETYRHDLVNVARQTLSNQAGELYTRTMAAYKAKDLAAYRKSSRQFLQLIGDLDELLASNDEFLLGAWLEDAKRWGQTDAERDRLEWNARRVLTLWGNTKEVRDYARKEWSGMLAGFYAKRWELFFRRQIEALEANKPFDPQAFNAELLKWEDRWASQKERYPAHPKGDSIGIARRLLQKYQPVGPGPSIPTIGKGPA